MVLKSGDAPGSAHRVYSRVFNGYAIDLSPEAAEALSHNPNVQSVSPEVTYTTSETWGLDRIDQRQLPLDNLYQTDRSGSGVHAYIIDSGIRSTHSEFTGRIGNGVDFSGTGNTEDCLGHGTHVSGTVGGSTYGVAKAVTIHPVRVFPCAGSTSSSTVIAAVDWVAKNHQTPCVVNMSLGSEVDAPSDLAVQGLINSGCSVVAAAGNSSLDACNQSPARLPAVLTVAATDQTDTRASFSNFGSCVDLFAPGVSITSAWYTSDVMTGTLSGTSMASPHVAGAAVLYLQGRPDASPSEVSDSLKAYSSKGVVKDAGSANWNLVYSGRSLDPNDPGPGPIPPPPIAPSNFLLEIADEDTVFTDGSTSVLVSWSDNSNNELYFESYLSSDKGDARSSTPVANFPAYYTRLTPGTWTGHIRAVNAGGASAWSNSYTLYIPGSTSGQPPTPCRLRGRSGKCK